MGEGNDVTRTLSGRDREELLTSMHEAAHMVLAIFLDLDAHDATIWFHESRASDDPAYDGLLLRDAPVEHHGSGVVRVGDGEVPDDKVDAHLFVALAGAETEARVLHKLDGTSLRQARDQTYASVACSHDVRNANALLGRATLDLATAKATVVELVLMLWDAITVAAGDLRASRRLRPDEVSVPRADVG